MTALDDFSVGYRQIAAAAASEVRGVALDRSRRHVLDAFASAPGVPPPAPSSREVAAR